MKARVGMRCKTQLASGEAFIYASSYSYSPEKLEFTETNESDKTVTRYTIDILGEKKSRLTLDYYVNNNFVSLLLFNKFKRDKLQQTFHRSLEKLNEFSQTLVIPS